MSKDLNKEHEEMRKVLARFNLREMRCIVLERFSKLSWDDVIEMIQEKRESLSSKTVAAVLVEILRKKHVTMEVLDRTLANIKLTELSEHSQRRLWFSYQLQGDAHPKVLARQDIVKAVTQHCVENAVVEVRVVAIRRESFYWLMVRERKPVPKKSKKVTPKRDFKAPLFFTAPFKEPFLFAPHKKISETILQSVVAALGYNSSKRLRLSDSNVVEMLKILKLHQQKAAGQSTLSTAIYQPGPPRRLEAGGLDFTGRKSRQKYVDDRFGEVPPIKKFIAFSSKEKFCDGISDEEENFLFPVRLTIRSESVWNTIKTSLVETEAIQFPPPSYLELTLLTAKDEIKLRSQPR